MEDRQLYETILGLTARYGVEPDDIEFLANWPLEVYATRLSP